MWFNMLSNSRDIDEKVDGKGISKRVFREGFSKRIDSKRICDKSG